MAKIKKTKVKDLFSYWLEEDEEGPLLKISTTKKLEKVFAQMKEQNPKFDPQKYFEKMFFIAIDKLNPKKKNATNKKASNRSISSTRKSKV